MSAAHAVATAACFEDIETMPSDHGEAAASLQPVHRLLQACNQAARQAQLLVKAMF